MKNKIAFVFEGKDYTLEFTKNSVKEMERRGFVASEVIEKPLSVLPDMFAGAFIANHRFTKRKVIDAIFLQIDNKAELVNSLAELYSCVIDDFVDELSKPKNGLPWKRM